MDGCFNGLFSLAWVICGILTVLIPLVFRTMKVNDFQRLNNMYNWEEQQQEYYDSNYENQQSQYMNQNGEGYYQNKYEQMRNSGLYDVNQCKWFNLNCFSYYINENGEPEPSAGWFPNWFSGWTMTEEQREQLQDAGQTSGAMHFVYIWQIVMFLVILAYGYIVIKQNRIVAGVTVALVVFTNMCFLSMWYLADGSIVTDTDYVQQTGFYGQFAVLMFITNAWYVLFGIAFSVIFYIRGKNMHDNNEERKYFEKQHQQQQQQQDQQEKSYRSLEDDSPKRTSPSEPGWTTVE